MTPTIDQMRVLVEALARPELGSPRDTAPREVARLSCRLRGWVDWRGRLTAAGAEVVRSRVTQRIVFFGRTGPRSWVPNRSGPRFWDVRA